MFKTYFNGEQLITLTAGIAFFLISLIFHLKDKQRLSLFFLLVSAFFIFCFAALLDPFLNLWDERFHALVARNMMHHPFRPTLYDDPVVDMEYDRWDKFHVWLHKQPLFLWQIAISFRLFGLSEFTLRLPSVILGVVLVYTGYRMGKILVGERTGYITGIMIVSSLYLLELVSGRQWLDHNDFSFLVYISLSILALIEYHFSGKKKWIYLLGLFSGLAILCKWLAGLLVYFGWMVLKVMEKKIKLRQFRDIAVALLVTLAIALPWQIYTAVRFPAEAKLANEFNIMHFLVPLEGHSGPFWYHFLQFNVIYGKLAAILILPAFIIFYKKIKDKIMFPPILGMVVITYLFFSFAQTRMQSFTTIVSLLIFIPLAAMVDLALDYSGKVITRKLVMKLLEGIIILFLFFHSIQIEKLQARHTLWKKDNTYSRMLMNNRDIFKSLDLPGNTVIFNVKGQHYIELMFYTGLPSYRFIPSMEQCQDMKDKGRTIAIFKPAGVILPDYITDDKSVIVLEQQLQGYD